MRTQMADGAPLRLLLVSFADSPHAQGWASLLARRDFDVRLFTLPLRESDVASIEWRCPTYVTLRPSHDRRASHDVRWLLPVLPRTRTFATWLDGRFRLSARWLRHVIRTWRPHIVHSLPLDTGSKLARLAMEALPPSARPKWVVSSWGSDLSVGLLDPARRANLEQILGQCDGFMADCRKDLDLAERAGLDPAKRAFADSVPGNGGIDVARFAAIRAGRGPRNIVLVPKAFEREHANRVFTVIEALRLLGDALDGFEVHFLMSSPSARTWLAQMPEALRHRCQCHGHVPQSDVFAMLGRTRVMVAPSLSDGTPNVLLEAMAAGALPVMSPIESTLEWITDGRNGLLAHALYPDQIAAAIRRGLTDDELFDRAGAENWDIVRERADRQAVAEQVSRYYRQLAQGPA